MADVEEAKSTGPAAPGRHKPKPTPAGTREHAEHEVEVAFDRTTSANKSGTPAARVSAGKQLQKAVDGARGVGVGWERIGVILGIARGNAYHRHRKRKK